MIAYLVLGLLILFGLRLVRVPRPLVLGFALGWALLLVALAILVPGQRPTVEAARGLAALAILAGLAALYAFILRRVRRRARPGPAKAAAPAGPVRIDDDAALVAEIERLTGRPERRFSVLIRDPDGGIAAACRCSITGRLATLSHLHLAGGDAGALFGAVLAEAAEQGATGIEAVAEADIAHYSSAGFAVIAELGPPDGTRRLMGRDLP